jgi:hypothetical protein
MAESAGGVEFYVDVDTQGAVQSTKQIKTENDKVTKSFKGVDTQVTKTSKAVKSGLSGVGRGAGQAGIQIQQFIGQIQGGQNAMLALSQQSADLGFVLGAPLVGAIVGIAASIGGIMLPELFKTKDAVKALDDAMADLKGVMSETAEGANVVSNEIHALYEVSKQAAQASLVSALINAKNALSQVGDTAKTSFRALQDFLSPDDIDTAVNAIGRLNKEFKNSGESSAEAFDRITSSSIPLNGAMSQLNSAVNSYSKSLGITRSQSFDLIETFSRYEKTKSPEVIAELAKKISDLAVNTDKANPKLVAFLNEMSELSAKSVKTEADVKKLESIMGKLGDTFGKSGEKASKVASLIKALTDEAATYGKTERQIALYAAAQSNAGDEDIKRINAIFDTIEGLKSQEQAQKDAATAAKKYNDETFAALKREETARQNADKRRASEKARNRDQLQSSAGGIADNFGDPIAALEQQKARELEVLRQAEEAGLVLHTEYSELRAGIDEQYAEREQLIREEKFRQESLANELALSSIEALGVATTNTLSGLLSGTYSATEAMQQFANTILSSAIGALVDVGVQYVKNAVISQTADKAILASQAASKATNAAIHTAAVTATVAELSSLAAAGAFAATAAIPIVGPGLAPGAAALAAGATATLGSAAIASAPIAGARFNGGPVSAGKLYEVGEKNRPEMLQSGGKQYMIPGNNGNVTSNADMQSGGSAPQINVTVNNMPGQSAQISQTGDGMNRQMVIDIIGEQSAQVGSGLNRNINKNHNVTNRQGTNRRN